LMKSKTISKILGVGVSAGLVFGLISTLFAGPAAADTTKWTTVNTPSWEDGVILPGSDILDYAVGGTDGSVIYAVLQLNSNGRGCDTTFLASNTDAKNLAYALVKSDDGGVTWKDITKNVVNAANLPGPWYSLNFVSVAPDDKDWVVVAGYESVTSPGPPMVVASKDSGDNFSYAGDIKDAGKGTNLVSIYDLAVSIEVDSIHNIALAGESDIDVDGGGTDQWINGTVYRLKAGTWLTGSWEDTSYYKGWDGDPLGRSGSTPIITSDCIIACEFSPNFDLDDTIVCMGLDGGLGPDLGEPYIQSGIWESTAGTWNGEAGFADPVHVTADGDTLLTVSYLRFMGLALPADYDGTDSGKRTLFIYVDAINDTTGLAGGYVFRVNNADLSPVCGPSGDPVLASIAVHGDADSGKMMIGEYVKWDNAGGWDPLTEPMPTDWGPVQADCCAGVRVWHTEQLDFCCPKWDGACKDPSGFYMALVKYTPDGLKEYATTSGNIEDPFYSGRGLITLPSWLTGTAPGTPGDESAFSVSLDDAVSFNQLGLIDTNINKLSDVAVCPDCSVIYLSTIQNTDEYSPPCEFGQDWQCSCDSVWRSYDNGATWERIYYLENPDDDELLLRLPCDTTEECCTIYVGIQGATDIYYSRDCGQCWNNPPATKITIQDFAVESENIVYVIDEEGMLSKSTQYGRRWSDKVDTGLNSSYTITSCCVQGFIVVGPPGNDDVAETRVAWSDDGGDTWNLTDKLPAQATGEVTVACDPTCVGTIYAAVDGVGIYRTTTDDGSWTDMNALATDYSGIVVAREGTLYASSDDIGVDPTQTDLCKRFGVPDGIYSDVYSGVARNLTPCETACCGTEDWDYLICGLGTDEGGNSTEFFDNHPHPLKLCGCLSSTTNTILWAIDKEENGGYKVSDGSDGALWSYEDCAAKVGITLLSPADNAVLDCQPCAGCGASPFTLKWERMCNACSYDIEIMDEDGNVITSWTEQKITGDPPALYVDYSGIECGNTYTWHVRQADTSCECIHSPWSETWSFTVAVGAADAIKLLSPVEGALEVPIENIGFSWSSVPDASSYSFVLSPNAAMTGALVSQGLSSTAFNFEGPLDYSKAYYWQIKAWKDSQLLTTSAIGVFNTGAEPVAPTPPVVVEPTPAPVLQIPPAQQITPTWIYAIIGIGAALAVVVIVLIVRTRRP